jgi:hypothetical protein
MQNIGELCWPLKAPGKSCPLGGLPAFFVRCATEDCSCTLVGIDVLEEGCDLWREVVERGCGERFQLLGTEISIDASRSRAEPVPSLLFEVRLQLRNDGTSLCPKEKFMCRVSTKSQCEKDEEQ